MDTETIGIIGAGIILVFFLLNQSHKIDRDSLRYDIGNLVGSSFLIYYSWLIEATPFLVLNLIWAISSLRDIFTDTRK